MCVARVTCLVLDNVPFPNGSNVLCSMLINLFSECVYDIHIHSVVEFLKKIGVFFCKVVGY